jgi:hypothetical protein
MYSEAIIPFRLDLGLDQAGPDLFYRPWSTRTVKLNVTAASAPADGPALRLRAKRMADKVATGLICGYADQDDSLVISWGGGHEDGPCIKADDKGGHAEACVPLAAGDGSNIYLNLKHLGPAVPDTATLTLEAYDPASQTAHASLALLLQKPAETPATIMRFQPTGNGRWLIEGDHLPIYDPRWWPRTELSYRPAAPPPLTIRQDKTRLLVEWAGTAGSLIVIHDETLPSLLTSDPAEQKPGGVDFELFNFDQNHFVLRVWFSWLNRNIGYYFAEQIRHEVPDAERFDFIIRKQSARVILVGTDLHWKELWGQVQQTPVRATYGLGLNLLRLKRTYDLKKKLDKHKHLFTPFNPHETVVRVVEDLARRDGLGEERVILAKGWRAHVPSFHPDDVKLDLDWSSSDVRQG